jgi:hypothetical protein
MAAQNKDTGTRLLVGTGGILLALVGGALTWDTYGGGGTGSAVAQLRESGTVTVGSLAEAVYYVPEGSDQNSDAAQSYALELVYSRTEGVPFSEVVADESKLPSKAGPLQPPPFATANTPTPEEATARARFVEAEEEAFKQRTSKVRISTGKKGFDDAQQMDRHDIVYLKSDPAVEPKLYSEVKEYTPGTGGPIGIGVLVAGLAMMGFGLRPKAKAAA